MHQVRLRKADGRELMLFSRRPIRPDLPAPSPPGELPAGRPHLRWHPLRAEWVTYAAYRQDRTFLPPPEYNPFAAMRDPAHPTEVPAGDWDIAVFENRYPALHPDADAAPVIDGVPTAPGRGRCEVVLFTQDPDASLGALPLDHVALLLDVWAERSAVLGSMQGIEYVLPFENRGTEVGVTLHHPHGQIYAYPVVPPIPARIHATELAYFKAHRSVLLQDLVRGELDLGIRVIHRTASTVAFVPPWARYPYEVWIAPIEARARIQDLDAGARMDFARSLKAVLLKYDALWQRPFPYLMAWFQAPSDGRAHPECHAHVEFFPPCRTPTRLKYLAGTELAAGFYAMDALPEDKARELQAVHVALE